MTEAQEAFLLALAKAREPRVGGLLGNAGSTTAIRRHVCNICGACVATSSARWAPTVGARLAMSRHLARHARIFVRFRAWAEAEQVRLDEQLSQGASKDVARRAHVVARGLAMAEVLET